MAKLGATVAAIAAIITFAATRRQKTGAFLGIPYDWRWPTLDVLRERIWNPTDQRVLTPHVFGWGWSVNLPVAWRRLRAAATRYEYVGHSAPGRRPHAGDQRQAQRRCRRQQDEA